MAADVHVWLANNSNFWQAKIFEFEFVKSSSMKETLNVSMSIYYRPLLPAVVNTDLRVSGWYKNNADRSGPIQTRMKYFKDTTQLSVHWAALSSRVICMEKEIYSNKSYFYV